MFTSEELEAKDFEDIEMTLADPPALMRDTEGPFSMDEAAQEIQRELEKHAAITGTPISQVSPSETHENWKLSRVTDRADGSQYKLMCHLEDTVQSLVTFLENKLLMDFSFFTVWLDGNDLPLDCQLGNYCVKDAGRVVIYLKIQVEESGFGKIVINDILNLVATYWQPQNDNQMPVLEQPQDFHQSQCIGYDDSPLVQVNTESQLGVDELHMNEQLQSHEHSQDQSQSFDYPIRVPIQMTLNGTPNEVQTPKDGEQKGASSAHWLVDAEFQKELLRQSFPEKVSDWHSEHIQHWIHWAQSKFPQSSVYLQSWSGMTGNDLCAMSLQGFQHNVPQDPNGLLWTHIQILKQSNLVAVYVGAPSEPASGQPEVNHKKTNKKTPTRLGKAKAALITESSSGNRSGNNGQIQLWQFLLEILTDKKYLEIIHWIGEEGEFKLEKPEKVAELWGERKGRKQMTYEKLSRGLRYYYDGDMLNKVGGKKFVYKFVCDLESILGYSASKLKKLVNEAAERDKAKLRFQ